MQKAAIETLTDQILAQEVFAAIAKEHSKDRWSREKAIKNLRLTFL